MRRPLGGEGCGEHSGQRVVMLGLNGRHYGGSVDFGGLNATDARRSYMQKLLVSVACGGGRGFAARSC